MVYFVEGEADIDAEEVEADAGSIVTVNVFDVCATEDSTAIIDSPKKIFPWCLKIIYIFFFKKNKNGE